LLQRPRCAKVTLMGAEDEVLAAAAAVVDRQGLARLTAEAVAAEAGVNRVTLYRRGVTPQRLATRLVERAAQEFREAMWPAITGPGSAVERLEVALATVCHVAERHLGILAGLFDGPAALFHLEDGSEVATRIEFVDPIRRLLLDGRTDATIREVDVEVTAEVLFNQVGWTYVHLRRSHGWSAKRSRDQVVGLAVAGVAA
jgi:AcrR family transcriptional regulator